MKVILEILKNSVVKEWKVPSKSCKGKFYKVELSITGEYSCDCESFKECSHIKYAKRYGKI